MLSLYLHSHAAPAQLSLNIRFCTKIRDVFSSVLWIFDVECDCVDVFVVLWHARHFWNRIRTRSFSIGIFFAVMDFKCSFAFIHVLDSILLSLHQLIDR